MTSFRFPKRLPVNSLRRSQLLPVKVFLTLVPLLLLASLKNNDAAEPLYNRLAEFEKGATNVVPGLATSWDISEDGLKYTFHLREGVKFHTTDYFTPTRDF